MGMLDSLTELATPAVGQIAERLGESETAVARGIPSAFASVLGGLVTKTSDPGASTQIFNLISNVPPSTNVSGDLQDMVAGLTGGGGSSTSGSADNFLNMLFGSRTSDVGDLLTRSAGFQNASSGSALLSFAASLTLGFLGKKVRDEGLNTSGFSSLLAGERDSILAAAPPGLTDLVDTGETAGEPDVREFRRRGTSDREYVRGTTGASQGRRWLWPVVGIAALALIWMAVSRRDRHEVRQAINTGASSLDTAARRSGAIVDSAGGEVSGALNKLGGMAMKTLPGGIVLNFPAGGTEARVIAFIESPRPVDNTTWFDFDRLTFATGTATILPQSEEQLENIVSVLKAYPNVKVKIGGYTDNVGDPTANLQLSQERALAVKQELVKDGIAANRIAAEGYGEQYPEGNNSTEEGRAKNRRIALRITEK